MRENMDRESMLEFFVSDTIEQITQLERLALDSEEAHGADSEINEMFRIVHMVKGAAAMMNYENITLLSHTLEDALYCIREKPSGNMDYSEIVNILLKSIDFIKDEILKIQKGDEPSGDPSLIIRDIEAFLSYFSDSRLSRDVENQNEESKKNLAFDLLDIKGFKATVFFEYGCEMENIRAFNIVHNLKKIANVMKYTPSDIIDNPNSAENIRENGFEIVFNTDLSIEDMKEYLSNTIFLRELKLEKTDNTTDKGVKGQRDHVKEQDNPIATIQSIISVNVSKLDKLMDLVGELVITQSMVIQNPDIQGLILENFNKTSRQLQKITNELQDAVMSIRMVPLSVTFQKMHRIVRDMCRKLDKEVKLEIVGEKTEVDKNIIEHLTNPLIHLIRNAVDHGIESAEERLKKSKPAEGKILLEARNEGGDVWIIVKDDGGGLNKEYILERAKQRGLLNKPAEELTDREIYSYITVPGFSTKEEASEYSGRGVGMDVAIKNIEEIGGSLQVDSSPDLGTTILIKVPLTLAIINGMKLKVGKSIFVIPMTSIREIFKAEKNNIITTADNNEMIMVRGECYPILRLHDFYKLMPDTRDINNGILIMVEYESKRQCLFADALLGEQQVVVKAVPEYIKKIKAVTGCTVLGDGRVSLVMDVAGLFNDSLLDSVG